MKLSRGVLFNSKRLECKLERGVMVMAKLKKTLTHLRKGESGQGALAIVVILLMLGAIILTPLLVFMSTGIKAGGVYESKLQEFYAADAGVEDGLWRIKNDKLSGYDEYAFSTSYTYDLPAEINNKNVTVNITNIWIPSNIATPNSTFAKSIIENGTLIVTGKVISTGGQRGYEIKISYYNRSSDDPSGTNLKIATIGAWLSGGFNYTSGSGNLSNCTSCVPYCGGQAIIWNLNNQTFKLGTAYPLVRTFTFNFTGPATESPNAVSWITTTGVSAIPYSWDADTKPYRIESTAGSTTTEAYVIKNELRKLGSAVSGDYVAIGNSLLTPSATSGVDKEYRDRLLMQSSDTIQSSDLSNPGYIPPDAQVEGAYLYWSGWIDYHYWYKSGRSWYWSSDTNNRTGLKYPSSPTTARLTTLVETTAKVNTVKFGAGTAMQPITTHQWQVMENVNHPGSWSYSCFCDLTKKDPSTGKSLFDTLVEAGAVNPNGTGTYTLSHADAVVNLLRPGYNGTSPSYKFNLYNTASYTGYPLGTPATKLSGDWNTDQGGRVAYAGWSLIIIYSSPETKGHQLYLYDDLLNCGSYGTLQFPISGFLAPDEIKTEGYAAKLTCFVGDGDEEYSGDYVKVNNGSKLSDGFDPNNVWNSKSVGLSVSGIDIDTFTVSYPTIQPGDTSAQVKMPTDFDQYNLIYIILSFRSSITTGGTISYLIVG